MQKIIIQLLGGLGNQMFQYAIGKRLALCSNKKLLVDTSILEDHSPGRHETNRKYKLNIFKLRVTKATTSERWLYNTHSLPLAYKIFQKVLNIWTSKFIYQETQFSFDEKIFYKKPEPRYIKGLWQSYKYFEAIKDVIQEEFNPNMQLNSIQKELVCKIKQENSVCIHVRRGDYIFGKASSKLGFVGEEYYQKAVKNLQDKTSGKLKFIVFSDDINWCRNSLRWLGSETIFCEEELSNGDEGVELNIMSQGSCFIIANSTFSWWAAWLSKSKKKKIIAPQKWFVDCKDDTKDLCPPDWQRI